MSESLEHHEHAEHAAEHGNKRAALLIAALAAALAICEQQGKLAEMSVTQNSLNAVDSWAQYQAKSIRSAVARDIAGLEQTLGPASTPEQEAARKGAIERLNSDQASYETDPKNGKEAIAKQAEAFEATREHALERSHMYDNAAAALQLGIVLATASVVAGSTLLIRLAVALGAIGVALGVLGVAAPGLL
jgi:small-conductance mechanosensitive channel